MPEVASAPAKLTVSARRYQPPPSGCRSAEVVDGGRGRVVLERDAGGAADVAGVVDTGRAEGDAGGVGPRIRRRGARGDTGDRVRAACGDADRPVVPAVRVRPSRETRAHARGGRVELDGERRRARVPGGVGTASGQCRAAGVRPGVRRGRSARRTRRRLRPRPTKVTVTGSRYQPPSPRSGTADVDRRRRVVPERRDCRDAVPCPVRARRPPPAARRRPGPSRSRPSTRRARRWRRSRSRSARPAGCTSRSRPGRVRARPSSLEASRRS